MIVEERKKKEDFEREVKIKREEFDRVEKNLFLWEGELEAREKMIKIWDDRVREEERESFEREMLMG